MVSHTLRRFKPDAFRKSSKSYWLVVTVCISIIAAFVAGKIGAITVVGAIFILFVYAKTLVNPMFGMTLWLITSPILQSYNSDTGEYLQFPATVFHRVLMIVIILGVLMTIKSRKTSLKISITEIMQLIFVVGLLFSVARPEPLNENYRAYDIGRLMFANPILPFMACFATRRLIRDEKRLFRVILTAAFVTFYLSMIAMYEHQTGKSWFLGTLLYNDIGLGRVAVSMGNPAVLGTTLGMFIIFTLHGINYTKNKYLKAFLIASVCLGFIATYYTYTRSAMIALPFGLVLLMIMYPKYRAKLIVGFTIFALMVILFLPSIQGSAVYRTRLAKESTAIGRVVLMRISLILISQKPLFGWGFLRYDSPAKPLFKNMYFADIPEGAGYSTSHNTYLTIIAENGILGFLPFFFAMVIPLIQSLKVYKYLPRGGLIGREYLIILWAILLVYIFNTTFLDMRFFSFAPAYFWTIIGLIQVLVDKTEIYKAEALKRENKLTEAV